MYKHLITYDLRAPQRDYSSLYRVIESLGSGHRRLLESVWLVQTPSTSAQVAAQILPHLDQNDGILVAPVTEGLVGLRLDQAIDPRLGVSL